MNFKNLDLKIKYRSSDNDIVRDFYIPVLSEAVIYKRAVGFFSSTALLDVSRGIASLVKNGGRIQIIASPKLQEQDIEAINKGYEDREKVIEQAIMRSIYHPSNSFEEERFNLLAHLIANDTLDIKLAFFEDRKKVGLYHEKIGLIYDQEGNKIAFTGSLNESTTAFTENFESIDVFCSWKGNESLERVQDKEKDFNLLWKDNTNKITVTEFPLVAKDKILSYQKENIQYNIDRQEYKVKEPSNEMNIINQYFPKIPDHVDLYDYQKEAVVNWEDNNYVGIFNMATGTGKTFTGLAAVAKLYQLTNRLAVIIVCPYQHLVEQWVEDILDFNMDPIIGYSASTQRNWKKILKDSVIDFKLGVINHFCFVTTNATYASDFVQRQINRLKDNIVLVIDEAHNFGATNLSTKLSSEIPYRLALSATIERHRDPEGTNKLFNYFGDICYQYKLERAIRENKLTKYYYYPVLVYLTDEELVEYRQLSKQMIKCFIKGKNGGHQLSDIGKKIAIKRARLVAGARNKLHTLVKKMKQYKNESHILVYCGATTIEDIDYKYGKPNINEVRQIEAVGEILGNQLNMKVSQFTSEEDSAKRELLKKEFSNGENLQTLIAIRCLDEGVNIPEIKIAFILASSTNPKEYVQRRGRVLRKASNKNFATIFDFITIPRPLSQVKHLPIEEVKGDISLVQKEIVRMTDFADLSLNPQDSYKLITELRAVYDLDKYSGGDIYGD